MSTEFLSREHELDIRVGWIIEQRSDDIQEVPRNRAKRNWRWNGRRCGSRRDSTCYEECIDIPDSSRLIVYIFPARKLCPRVNKLSVTNYNAIGHLHGCPPSPIRSLSIPGTLSKSHLNANQDPTFQENEWSIASFWLKSMVFDKLKASH